MHQGAGNVTVYETICGFDASDRDVGPRHVAQHFYRRTGNVLASQVGSGLFFILFIDFIVSLVGRCAFDRRLAVDAALCIALRIRCGRRRLELWQI
ncbi:TPA: hypothetical protein L6A21_13030 [Pseudomonas aeruginosa]|nr:hypothetical protein [Pseudomonas aeruginosa]HBP6224586.1 hypothetical protein [Pseudomonas aeruginosa]HBP6231635.1 hypothetical protein [Pseudomonas aeruginosa]HBP6519930.1 hypothetical protein [Pseudomonas aeruginosa]